VKQVAQNLRTGAITVEDVPPPMLAPGRVLVANRASLVSAGTERVKVETGRKSLLGKARARPDLAKQVVEKARKDGLGATYRTVKARLESLSPIGYSAAGIVIGVGPDVEGIAVGDAVACAGAGYANHAEVVCVPKNLAVKIPDGVDFGSAAYATVGAIAMQGVRRAELELGESVAVIGLGLLGQLACQIAKAAGCKVIGFDLSEEAAELARSLGADCAYPVSGELAIEAAMSFSNGRGVDAVVITAATGSSEPIESAGMMARSKGRVVVVGDVGLTVPRPPYYAKELDLRLSTSYGPGRYDPEYEEAGHDYPYGYVRWTEQRNMEAFLRLVRDGAVSAGPLTTHRFSIDEAPSAYEVITSGADRYVGVLIEYPGWRPSDVQVPLACRVESVPGKARVGLIGAGNFATGTLLPGLKADGRAQFVTISSARGLSAASVAKNQGFLRVDDSVEAVFEAQDLDAVVVATRHNTHATFAAEGLKCGKAVFVEKPPALSEEELRLLAEAYSASEAPLMVGFNRVFSPHFERVRTALDSRATPLVATVRVNAGSVPDDSWVLSPTEGGGRIVGEACHFVDLLVQLVGARPTSVVATRAATSRSALAEDNVVVTIAFSDGSVGTLAYTSEGDTSSGKERIEVFADGTTALIDDFSLASITRDGKTQTSRTRPQDKGHRAEISRFLDMAISRGRDDRLIFWQLLSMHVTLQAVASMSSGGAIHIDVPEWLGFGG